MRCIPVAILACLLALPGLALAQGQDFACPPAPVAALELPATRAAIAARKPVLILAFGSSSTEGFGASDLGHSYPAQLQAVLQRALPVAHVTVLNRGRGGQAIAEMMARLEADVVAAQPTLVVWQAGTNDAVREGDPAVFRAGMEQGMARIRATGADLVLMDSQRAPRILAAPATPLFDSLLERLAEEGHASLFSRAALMRRWQAEGTSFAAMLGGDGFHHNDRGYHCVAAALGRAIVAAVRPAPVVAGR